MDDKWFTDKSKENNENIGEYKKIKRKSKNYRESYRRFTGKIEILPRLGGKTYNTIQRAKELDKDNSITRIVILVDTKIEKRWIEKDIKSDSDKIKILSLNETNGKILDILEKLDECMYIVGNYDPNSEFKNYTKENPKILLDISDTKIIRLLISRLNVLNHIDLVCIPLEKIL